MLCGAVDAVPSTVAARGRKTASLDFDHLLRRFGGIYFGFCHHCIQATAWLFESYSVWNLHARFLERDGGAYWTALFSKTLSWTHPDYPLLIPALIAQFWAVLHTESVIVPIAVAFFFTFGNAAVLIGAVRHFRGWNQALIAGAFLLGSAELIEQGVVQYANLPLAFFMASALALLCFEDAKSSVLAGAMAGFAAWTKNEGLLFVVVLIAARFYAQRRISLQFFYGLAPVLAVVAFFKLRYAPLSMKPVAVDFGQVVTVLQGFVVAAFQLGVFLIPAILLLAAYAWLAGFQIAENRTTITTVTATVVLMLVGDVILGVILGTDAAQTEQALMQVFPSALLGLFVATNGVHFGPPVTKRHPARKAVATRRG